ncbi:MAG TPA: 4-(cytidine 5'-diphospho)-2-C-methyl-D-erythritol kinase [Bacteroidia bacterium]|nr:4-(cytidine 5'-diphospho)-2-C-methyl-D-erythritol kinase [Bacteroidia bacterium]
MLVFPNCKINLGLYVTEKRADGYHNIESVFYPINWTDALEVLENKDPGSNPFSLQEYPAPLGIAREKHLIYKAWLLLSQRFRFPPLAFHLYKNLPMGAGLGGGSSDAAFCIEILVKKFKLDLSQDLRTELAAQLGSDCAFFIQNSPRFASGRGEILHPVELDLSAFFILLVYPGIHCNTADAYRAVHPRKGRTSLMHLVRQYGPEEWKNHLMNDFEESAFSQHPILARIKQNLYDTGAVYASMSGSGSTVYGLYKQEPDLSRFKAYSCYLQKPGKLSG